MMCEAKMVFAAPGWPVGAGGGSWAAQSSPRLGLPHDCIRTVVRPLPPLPQLLGVVNSCPQVAGAVEPRVVLRRGTSLGDPWGGSCGVGAAVEGRGGGEGVVPRGEGVVPSVLRPGLQPPGARWQGPLLPWGPS